MSFEQLHLPFSAIFVLVQGAALRASYGALLDEDDAAALSSTYLRSTHVPRTLESLQAILAGVWPGLVAAQAAGAPPVVVHSRKVRGCAAAAAWHVQT